MRHAAFALAALLGLATPAAFAQEEPTAHITIRPDGQGDAEISFPTINNPNYLDAGPLQDPPGSDKSEDYEDQAGGNDPSFSGPGSDVDADIMPDNDGAYDEQ